MDRFNKALLRPYFRGGGRAFSQGGPFRFQWFHRIESWMLSRKIPQEVAIKFLKASTHKKMEHGVNIHMMQSQFRLKCFRTFCWFSCRFLPTHPLYVWGTNMTDSFFAHLFLGESALYWDALGSMMIGLLGRIWSQRNIPIRSEVILRNTSSQQCFFSASRNRS